jgi:hypothetical protein
LRFCSLSWLWLTISNVCRHGEREPKLPIAVEPTAVLVRSLNFVSKSDSPYLFVRCKLSRNPDKPIGREIANRLVSE